MAPPEEQPPETGRGVMAGAARLPPSCSTGRSRQRWPQLPGPWWALVWACEQASASSWGLVGLPRLPPAPLRSSCSRGPGGPLTCCRCRCRSCGACRPGSSSSAQRGWREGEKCQGDRVTGAYELPAPPSPEHGSVRLVAGAQGQPQATEAQESVWRKQGQRRVSPATLWHSPASPAHREDSPSPTSHCRGHSFCRAVSGMTTVTPMYSGHAPTH